MEDGQTGDVEERDRRAKRPGFSTSLCVCGSWVLIYTGRTLLKLWLPLAPAKSEQVRQKQAFRNNPGQVNPQTIFR